MTQVDSKAKNFLSVKHVFMEHRNVIVIILITILAGLIRVCYLGDHSLWYDEAASAKHIVSISDYGQGDPWGLVAFQKIERVPPLYFLLLTPFQYLAKNEWVLRLPSVIYGTVAIPLMYLVCTQIVNQSVALVATLLLAFSPFHIYYSQEMRPYSLFMLFALLALFLFHLGLREHKNIYFFGLIIVISLGIYTHTYMILVLMLLDLDFALNWKTNRSLIVKWLSCHLAIGLFCIPALYILIYHVARGNVNLVDFPPGLRSIAGTFYIFTLGRFFFPTLQNLPLIIVQGLIWGFGLLAGVWSLLETRSLKLERHALTLAISGFGIYIIIWVISMSLKPLFDEARIHYLIFIFPIYLFIVAQGLTQFSKMKLRMVLISTALLISLASNYPYFFQWDMVGRGNFRAAAAYIQSYILENDRIFHTTNTSTLPIQYYLNYGYEQVLFDPARSITFSDDDRFWLVIHKTSGAVDYMGTIFGQQGIPSLSQESSSSICTRTLDYSNFTLVRSIVFPGKNELSVCLFRREVY